MEKLLSNCKNAAGEGNASKVEGFVRREGVTSDQTLEGGKVEDSGRGMKGVNKTSHKVVLINKEDFVNSFAQLGHIGMEGDVGISAAMEGQEVVSVVVNSTFMEENESDSTQIKGRNEENRATVNTEGENINDMEGTENSDTVKGKGENSDTVVVTGEDVEGENSDATKEGEVNRRRQTQPARRKSCMPKFVPPRKIVCGVPFCLFCKAKSCKSCKMCLMKKKCMLRQCPNLSNKKDNFSDLFPNCATLMVNSSSQDTSIIQDDSVLENDKAIAIIMTEDIGRDYGSEYGSGTSSHSLSASQIVSTSILSMVEHGSADSNLSFVEHGSADSNLSFVEHGSADSNLSFVEHGSADSNLSLVEHGSATSHLSLIEHGPATSNLSLIEHGPATSNLSLIEHGPATSHLSLIEHGPPTSILSLIEHGPATSNLSLIEHGPATSNLSLIEHGPATVNLNLVEHGLATSHPSLSEHGSATSNPSLTSPIMSVGMEEVNKDCEHENKDKEARQSVNTCERCGKTFKQLKSFNVHKCGRKLQKIKCPSCSKEISRSNFAKHIKLHSSIRYQCDLCTKAFIDEAKKEKHMKNHADTKCSICGKKFTRSLTLKEHSKVHKTYNDNDELGREESQKLEGSDNESIAELKYKNCSYCEKKLSSLTDLTKHMRNEHSDKAVKCDLCTKIFFSQKGFKSHKKLHSSQTTVVLGTSDSNSGFFDATASSVNDVMNYDQNIVYFSQASGVVTIESGIDIDSLENMEIFLI
jgi:hypothetical protein